MTGPTDLTHFRPHERRRTYTKSCCRDHSLHLLRIEPTLQSRIHQRRQAVHGQQRTGLNEHTTKRQSLVSRGSCKYIQPSKREEITLTHSTRDSSPGGFLSSTGFLPVISSKSTTPKEKTSDLSVSFPVMAYSGARYLQKKGKREVGACTEGEVQSGAGYGESPKGAHDPCGHMGECV